MKKSEEDKIKIIEILLQNRWVYIEADKQLYYNVKDSLKDIKDFIEIKLGYNVIVTPDIIKVEKIPAKAEKYMGINDFNNKLEYALLCEVLMFLEDKDREEQFILSQLTEYIEINWVKEYEQIDWTLYNHRRYLIKVLKFCNENNLIKVTDGDENLFTHSQTAEVLYENTGLSKYLLNRLSGDIFKYTGYKDFEIQKEIDFEQSINNKRKNNAYRNIIMSPVVYSDSEEFEFIVNNKEIFENDLDRYLNSKLFIYKNCALLVYSDNKSYKYTFPNIKNISDIILQLANEIRNLPHLKPDKTDCINLSYAEFSSIIEECRDKYMSGWSKTYKDLKLKKLQEEIENEMEYFNMIKIDKNFMEVKILPLACIMVGNYI